MTERILKRLRYPNAVIDAVVSGVVHHMQFKDVAKMRTATLKRFMAREHFEDELALHRADCLGSDKSLGNHDFLLEKKREFENAPLLPQWFVHGGDLVARGWNPGPELGQILTEAHDLQLDGTHNSREQALAWLDERSKADPD